MSYQRSWQPGRLRERVRSQRRHALQTGALQPIATHYQVIEEAGIPFVVRVLANLARKQAARQGQSTNPFLPPEADLYVTDVSPTHLCLLNKFNVVEDHLLIITRAYEAQDTWLTLADFEALWKCMAEIDGLAFYNAGTAAGASQPHKHLQLVPLPIVPEMLSVPIEAAVRTVQSGIGEAPELPFQHAIAPLSWDTDRTPAEGAASLCRAYHRLLAYLGIEDPSHQWQGPQTTAYNLLGTRDWLMLVPRSQESYRSISVNSLGFAGSLLVKNVEKLEVLKAIGPMTLLRQVSIESASA
jgi:ATP adenylyltransferase